MHCLFFRRDIFEDFCLLKEYLKPKAMSMIIFIQTLCKTRPRIDGN